MWDVLNRKKPQKTVENVARQSQTDATHDKKSIRSGKDMKINREDMLELTRRMTPKRNCFSRIAGAYFDEEGFVDGTFNRHFLNL